MTGMKLHPDSRFKGVMISRDGKAFSLCPALYKAEMTKSLPDVPAFGWEDGQGFQKAFAAGCAALGILDAKVAFNGGVRAVDMLAATQDTKIRCMDGSATGAKPTASI